MYLYLAFINAYKNHKQIRVLIYQKVYAINSLSRIGIILIRYMPSMTNSNIASLYSILFGDIWLVLTHERIGSRVASRCISICLNEKAEEQREIESG